MEVGALAAWDLATYMPKGAIQDRAAQAAVIDAVIHQKMTDGSLVELVNSLAETATLNPHERRNIQEAKRDIDRAVKIPVRLVEALSKGTSLGYAAWVKARQENDYALFKEHLKTLISLRIEEAGHVGYEKNPYAYMLDEFEPGITEADIQEVFDPLKEMLPPLIQEIHDTGKHPKREFYKANFPIQKQDMLCRYIADQMDIPEERSRTDTTVHPFCTAFGLNDVRRCIRYSINNPFESLYSAMHENGHALYELGIDPCLAQTPAGKESSLGIHESQSRLWENIIGRSRAFFNTYMDKFREVFGNAMKGFSVEDLYFLANEVRPSFIRTEADEVTYNMHIVLRFDIERAIFNNTLPAQDIPDAWNAGFEKYFGFKVDCTSHGMLHDVHWSHASFGYFPTYTLGNLYAAQLKGALEKALGPTTDLISRHNLQDIKKWLQENVHRHGRLKTAKELIKDVTREPLNPDYFFNYIKEKFSDLYGL
jgi:carboxypeptidase Taq